MLRFAAFSAACLMLAAPALAGTAEPLKVAHAQPSDRWLRGVEPGATGSIEPASAPAAAAAAPVTPPCPPDRKVGTGAGFCLIN